MPFLFIVWCYPGFGGWTQIIFWAKFESQKIQIDLRIGKIKKLETIFGLNTEWIFHLKHSVRDLHWTIEYLNEFQSQTGSKFVNSITLPKPSKSISNWNFNPMETHTEFCASTCAIEPYPWNELVKVSLSKITCHEPQTQTQKWIYSDRKLSTELMMESERERKSFKLKVWKKYRSNFRTVLWLLIDSISFWMLCVSNFLRHFLSSIIIIINIDIIVFVVVDIFFFYFIVFFFFTRGINIDMAYDITSKTIFVLLNRQIKESVCQ